MEVVAGATVGALEKRSSTFTGGADTGEADMSKGSWYLIVGAVVGDAIVGGVAGGAAAGALGRLNADDAKFFACVAIELTELFLGVPTCGGGGGGCAHCCA